METANLKAKAITATANYLTRRGYEVITAEGEEPAPIIAREDETLVFVSVQVSTEGLTETAPDRETLESVAFAYITQNATLEPDFKVRFDIVALWVAGEGKALIRHHINALG